MRLLIISSRLPYPIEKGDKLRLYHQIKTLSEHFELYLYSMSTEDYKETSLLELKKYCKEVRIHPISKADILQHFARNWFSELPLQVIMYSRDKIRSEIKEMIQCHQIDHIYCQLIRAAENVREFKIPKTLDYMDAFSYGMIQRKSTSNLFMKWLYSNEATRVSKYETQVYDDFDMHTIITSQDAKRLPLDNKKVYVVQNGVDHEYFSNKLSAQDYDLVFVGNMGYLPNIDAAKYLANKILPALIKKTAKEYSLFIAGARPSDQVIQLAQNDNVIIGGWMEDIRSAYEAGRYFVAPIFNAIGQQNKILEALSMELPCIVNQSVADGLGLIHQKECLIADSVDEFVEAIIRLENQPEIVASLIVNGLEKVKKVFNWNEQSLKLVQLIKSCHATD